MTSKRARTTTRGQSSQNRGEGSSSRIHASTGPAPSGRRGNNSNPLRLVELEHIARFQDLSERVILPTRYYCEHTLHSLGLLDDVMWLFGRVGMIDFLNVRNGTYRAITLEFLSSLEVEVIQGEHCAVGKISFRLLGRQRELTLNEFNSIFSLPQNLGFECRRVPLAPFYLENAFWNSIAYGRNHYRPSSAKGTKICNPCFRYAHRVLSNTVFARDDSQNVVRSPELYFLYAMLHSEPVDVGSYLAQQLLRVAKQKEGKICIGGLITPIALHYGWQLDESDRVLGSERLDYAALEAMHACKTVGENPSWYYPNHKTLSLPSPFTSVRNPNNFLFVPNVDHQYAPPDHAPDHAPTQHHDHTSDPNPLSSSSSPRPTPHPSSTHSFDFVELRSSIQSLQTGQTTILESVHQLRESMHDQFTQWNNWFTSQGFHPPPPPPPNE